MDYIEQMTDTPPTLDENTATEQDTSTEDVSIDTSADNAENPAEEATPTETPEPQEDDSTAKIAKLQSELDKANGRMSEKDRYINELRNQKPEVVPETESAEASGDFWDDPEAKYNEQQSKLDQLQFQLAEQNFARTKSDYFEVVNVDEVNKAIALDPEFASEFNSSENKFETAYTHLKKQTETQSTSEAALRAEIKAELEAELNIKPKKTIPKSVSNVGNTNSNKSEAPDDGFSAVFGSY